MNAEIVEFELALRTLARLLGWKEPALEGHELAPWEDEAGNWSEEKLRAIFLAAVRVTAHYAGAFPEHVEALEGQVRHLELASPAGRQP